MAGMSSLFDSLVAPPAGPAGGPAAGPPVDQMAAPPEAIPDPEAGLGGGIEGAGGAGLGEGAGAGGLEGLLAGLGGDVAAETAPPEEQPGPGDEVTALKDLLTGLRGYLDLQTVTEGERAEAAKALMIFQKLLASNEKMADQATGGSPMLRKQIGPLGPAGGPA